MRLMKAIPLSAVAVVSSTALADAYLVTMQGVVDQTISGGSFQTPYFTDVEIGDAFTHAFVYEVDENFSPVITSFSITVDDQTLAEDVGLLSNQAMWSDNVGATGRVGGLFGTTRQDGAVHVEFLFRGSTSLSEVFATTGYLDPTLIDDIYTSGIVHHQGLWSGGITDLTVIPVPAPGVMSLLGVLGLATVRRRRE